MTTVTVGEAQARLPELIRGLAPGEEVVITEGGRAVARLVVPAETPRPRRFGTLRGTVLSMEGFDDPIEGFEKST